MPNTHATLTALFTDIANQIRAKKGTSGQIIADNFPSEIASIPTSPSGYLRYDFNNPAAVVGTANYIVITKNSELARIRTNETLFIRVLVNTTSNGVHGLYATNSEEHLFSLGGLGSGEFQVVNRTNSSGVFSTNVTLYPIYYTGKLTEASGNGRIHITEDGELRIYCNTSGYPLPVGQYQVELLWEE